MHLTYNHGIIISKQHIISTHKQKRAKTQTQMRNPSIHLTCEHPIIHLNEATTQTWQQAHHGNHKIM